MTNIPIYAGQLPAGFCPSTYQAMLNGFTAAQTVDLSSVGGSVGTPVVISAVKPANTSVIWARIDALGRFLQMYIYGQGAWLSAHPLVPGATVWWFAVLPNFTLFDGGESGTLGAQSGPMWQQAKDGNNNVIAAQFPVTAGTLAGGTVLALNGIGGEDRHILTVSEGAQDQFHRHINGRFSAASGGGADDAYMFTEASSNTTSGSAQRITGGSGGPTIADISSLSGNYIRSGIVDPTPVAVAGHENMPPYVVGYLLQRTSRIFYAVT